MIVVHGRLNFKVLLLSSCKLVKAECEQRPGRYKPRKIFGITHQEMALNHAPKIRPTSVKPSEKGYVLISISCNQYCVREITNPRKTLQRHAAGDGSEPHPKNKTHFRKAIRKWIRSNFDLMQSIAVVYLNLDYEPPPWGLAGKRGGWENTSY
ncbi:hypothetical protein CEXT_302241 [Caerostris extrusa]|uniref:GIY-YIG homing endonuclease n=1 Tax=Caerostris extrusa TaxID=172846 RepID=A0AAV4UJJ3_CAEEX|nr:hypothetical protein CEXT_302241 [Caerostris extrusa]